MKNNIFLYDGNCPFCTSLAKKLESRMIDDSVEFLSFREIKPEDLKEFHPSLSPELCSGEIQMIYRGVRYPGFFAIRRLSHYLRGYSYFSFILYLPLIPFLGMFILYLLKLRSGH
ncbi:MAG: DUF393 domain-containing protein [Leptospiraceae bacterium]|nr:DUF393 domain-containing protein [Leptospiraceae bacterium]MCP5501442.1 DUF393 domain-containing protein [Leptospiraceae bacterium]